MPGKPNKTQPSAASVEQFLAAVAPESRRADADALCALMHNVTGLPPRMWGPSIVGFGANPYRYDSGREGEVCRIGFSPRKTALVLYGLGARKNAAELAALGEATTGKGCIYVKRLDRVDPGRLRVLIERAWRT